MNKFDLAKNLIPNVLHPLVTDVFFSYSKNLKDGLTYFNPMDGKVYKDFIIDTPLEIYGDPFGTISIHIEFGGVITVFDDLEYGTMLVLFDKSDLGIEQLHFALNRGLTKTDFIHFANTQPDYHNFNLGVVCEYFREINLKKLNNYL